MVKYTVLLFAGLSEVGGSASIDVDAPDGASVSELIRAAEGQLPGLVNQTYRVAIDSRYATDSDTVPEGAEIAFIPPVSGG